MNTTTTIQLGAECQRQLGISITDFHNFNVEKYESLAEARTALLKQYRSGQYTEPKKPKFTEPTYTLESENGVRITGTIEYLRRKLNYKTTAPITRLVNGTSESARNWRLVS